jgi:hypothetical protein
MERTCRFEIFVLVFWMPGNGSNAPERADSHTRCIISSRDRRRKSFPFSSSPVDKRRHNDAKF